MNILYAVLLFVVLAGIFVLVYVLNSKTPKPEGCKDAFKSCEGCSITSCVNYPKNKEDIKNV